MSFDTMVSVGESKRTSIECTWNATLCCSSRPKGAYGTTDEAFVLILHVCLSPRDSNSNDSIRGVTRNTATAFAKAAILAAAPPPPRAR